MFDKTVLAIRSTLSGLRALRNAEEISMFHRLPASEGYRQAAHHCVKLFHRDGIAADIISYNADDKSRYWSQQMFQEWNCRGAELHLTYPCKHLLTDYRADNLALVARSAASDFRDKEIDLVLLDKGSHPEQYVDLDLEDKIAFVSGPPNAFYWAIEKGALGLVTDYVPGNAVRRPGELDDVRPYLTFSWSSGQKRAFCFCLTVAEGAALRQHCHNVKQDFQTGKSQHPYPKVTGHVDSSFTNGHMENVVATIPGREAGEIILLAHLCHGRASANDNASGCGGGIEIMNTLHTLIREKVLPQPRYTIRMVLVPEVVGTFAYLAERESELSEIKAGIVLDMIGRRQEEESGLIGVIGLPDSSASFLQDLISCLIEENALDAPTFNLNSYVSTVHIQNVPYMGGSDHYVLCDPSVNIPCVTMMQWLDKNYHTTADRVDQLDPKVLSRTCNIAAAYLYTLANLELDDVPLIMDKTRERFTERLTSTLRAYRKNELSNPSGHFDYLKSVFIQGTEDYARFLSTDDEPIALAIINEECNWLTDYTEGLKLHCSLAIEDECQEMPLLQQEKRYLRIPTRLLKGPITFVRFKESLAPRDRDKYEQLQKSFPGYFGMHSYVDLLMHRVNGERNLLEISLLASYEGRLFNPDFTSDYFDFLHGLGFISWEED